MNMHARTHARTACSHPHSVLSCNAMHLNCLVAVLLKVFMYNSNMGAGTCNHLTQNLPPCKTRLPSASLIITVCVIQPSDTVYAAATWSKSLGMEAGCTRLLMTPAEPLRNSSPASPLSRTTTPDLSVCTLNSSTLRIFRVAVCALDVRLPLRGKATLSEPCSHTYCLAHVLLLLLLYMLYTTFPLCNSCVHCLSCRVSSVSGCSCSFAVRWFCTNYIDHVLYCSLLALPYPLTSLFGTCPITNCVSHSTAAHHHNPAP